MQLTTISGADLGGVKGVRTPALCLVCHFLKRTFSKHVVFSWKGCFSIDDFWAKVCRCALLINFRIKFNLIFAGAPSIHSLLATSTLAVPVDYIEIVSLAKSTPLIKAHSIIQFVMPWNAWKMNQRVSRYSNFLGEAPDPPPARRRACRGLRPLRCPFLMDWTPALANS